MKKLMTFFLVSFLVTTKLFAGAVTINEASGRTATQIQTDISTAVSAGDTDITLQFADGGTWGASGAEITIAVPAGVTKLTFYAPSTVVTKPVLNLNTLTYADGLMTGGITFDGVKLITATGNQYLVAPTSTLARIPATLTVKNCWLEGYRAVLFSNLATIISDLLFTNNYFKNFGNSGIINVNTGTISKITIRKNTFNNVGGDGSGATASDYFIDFRSTNSVTSQIIFSNNTIYYPRTQGRGLFRFAGPFTTGTFKENNNLYSTGNATTYALSLLYTNVTAATTDADSTNYYSNKFSGVNNVGSMLSTLYTENTPSNLFVNPGANNFTINDPNFTGKIKVGNPACFYPATVAITGGSIVNLDYNLASGPSTGKTFSFSTLVLRGAVTFTAPADYELSTDNITYSGSLILGGLGSDLTNQTVYVRLKAGLAVGAYNESIVVSTPQASNQSVSCSGSVTLSLPPLDAPTDLSASAITYTGFHAGWSTVANAAGYTLRVLLNGSAVSTITGITANSYDVTGLTPGNTYTFAVTAVGDNVNYNSSLESSQSGSVAVPFIYLFTSLSTPGAGTITKSPSSISYSPNASVQLTAAKNFGYQFVNWVDSVSGTVLSAANPYTVSMDGTKHIQAVFNTLTTYNYTVNITGSTWGTVSLSPAPTAGKYEAGTTVTMTAVNDSVSTFLNWEDNTTGKVRSIIVDADKTFSATFSDKSFIVGWDLVTPDPKNSRPADYYSVSSNRGLFSSYEPTGAVSGWLTYTAAGIPCALLWTTTPTTVHRYFQASFSTVGYKNINVHSNMFAYNQFYYPGQKLQYSTDGTNFTDLKSCTLINSNWVPLMATLPVELENQTIVYLRWTADLTTTPVGTGNDGTGISNIYIFADKNIAPDPIKPTLISTVPANGSVGASANGSISLTFDKIVKAGTGNCTLGSTVLTPSFASQTVTFNYTKLAYNTQYTFHVPAGSLTNVDGVACDETTVIFTTMNRPQPAAKLFNAVVATDGSGDYTSIQTAINAVPDNNAAPYLIFVKNGTYNGHVDIPSTKPYVNLIGQSRDSVIISGARISGGSALYPDSVVYAVDLGATVVVKSANCYFENICFENKFGYANLSGPQALALYTQNDRVILNNCWLRSYQDTYLTTYGNVAYRHYLKNCRIEGAVDFIYGGGDVFFDKCLIYCTRSAGGYIVAPSHQTGTKWGYVFSNCTIDGPNASYTTYLGRPWANSPMASFFNTTCKIGIYSTGWWHSMGAIPAIFADYNSVDATGSPLDMSQRISTYDYVSNGNTITGTAKSSFTDTEAATYSYENVTTGTDGWDPRIVTEPTNAPANVTLGSGGSLNWDATQYAICYVVIKNNKVIGFTAGTNYTDASYIAGATYKLVAVSESGALSPATAAVSGLGTGANQTIKNSVYAYFTDKNLVVKNLIIGSTVSVYNFNGMLLFKQIAKSNILAIPVNAACVLRITSDNESVSLKVIK
ncbi:MAG: pectinesterase family protein [Paludibacter sp.]|nr:pectinesterase family protein [Paludibacter sp.]